DREARATLRRLESQRAALSTRYGQATTSRQRLAAVTDALRSASAPGAHQIEQARADQITANAANAVRAAVDELHQLQQRRAERTLGHTDDRRSRGPSRNRP